jgi:hypothetical protein
MAHQRDPARVTKLVQMQSDVGTFLSWALRVQRGHGPQAEIARQVVLAIVFAQLLAGADHAGPPHADRRSPRDAGRRRQRLTHRESLSGRRPRG